MQCGCSALAAPAIMSHITQQFVCTAIEAQCYSRFTLDAVALHRRRSFSPTHTASHAPHRQVHARHVGKTALASAPCDVPGSQAQRIASGQLRTEGKHPKCTAGPHTTLRAAQQPYSSSSLSLRAARAHGVLWALLPRGGTRSAASYALVAQLPDAEPLPRCAAHCSLAGASQPSKLPALCAAQPPAPLTAMARPPPPRPPNLASPLPQSFFSWKSSFSIPSFLIVQISTESPV